MSDMKIDQVEFEIGHWRVKVTHVEGAPGFGNAPGPYQASLQRIVYDAITASRYGAAFADHWYRPFTQMVSIRHGDSILLSLSNLYDLLGRSDTPDKDAALEAIRLAVRFCAVTP